MRNLLPISMALFMLAVIFAAITVASVTLQQSRVVVELMLRVFAEISQRCAYYLVSD